MTETALLADPSGATRVLGELRALGVQVSLDDFGSGQTSLGLRGDAADRRAQDRPQLHQRARDEPRRCRHRPAPSSTSATTSGCKVVAEGIETEEVWAATAATGCDLAQGFLLARPMPIGEVATWLAANRVPQMTPAAR